MGILDLKLDHRDGLNVVDSLDVATVTVLATCTAADIVTAVLS